MAGLLAAQSILDRAEEAMAKEDRIEAVSELSYRVEDWKGHKIDHFGELLLYGTFTVLKGEGAKEVEREVCGIFDSLDPRSRALILAASSQLPPTIIPRNCNAAVLRAIGLWLSRTPWRRTTYELKDICEEPDHEDPHIPLLSETPGKRGKLTAFFKRTKSAGSLQTPNKTLPSTPRAQTPRSITPTRSTQSTPPMSVVRRGNSPQTPRSMTAPAYNTGAKALKVLGILHPPELAACSPADLVESPSPSRSSKLSLSQKLQQRSPKKPIIYIPHWQESIYDTMRDPMHRLHFNRVFMHTALLFSDLPSDPPSSPKRKPCVVTSPDKKGKQIDVPFVPIRTTAVENAELKQASADGTALERPVNEQYKVYLFQRILLCCKEINPNKPKNKMLSTTKPLLDKKGKPRLQLKGRIFMQNVTDVITLNRKGMVANSSSARSSY